MGITEGGIRRLVKNGDLVADGEGRPLVIRAQEVDAERARRLELYDDIEDLSLPGARPSHQARDENVRLRWVEEALRDMAATEEMMDRGLDLARESRRRLVELITASLTADS